MGETLAATMLPFIIAMGVGMIVGGLVGVLVSRLLLGRTGWPTSPLPTRTHTTGEPAVAPANAHHAGARWMTARYHGRCHGCRTEITAGDSILYRPRASLCSGCGVASRPRTSSRSPSPRRA